MTKYLEYIALFCLPSVCIFGIITNLLVIWLYRQIQLKTKIQYSNMICSILHIIYLIPVMISDILMSPILEIFQEKFTNIFELYIDKYFVSALAIWITCVQIYIFTQHLLLISNRKVLFILPNIKYYIHLKK